MRLDETRGNLERAGEEVLLDQNLIAASRHTYERMVICRAGRCPA